MSDQASPPTVIVTPIAAPTPVKPGWKTTEFYLALVPKVIGAMMATGLIADGSLGARITGAVTMVLAQYGYTAARTLVKNAAVSP